MALPHNKPFPGHRHARVAGTGSFLPGEPVPADQIGKILGELDSAPKKLRDWMERIRSVMKELVEVEYYHFAIDPVTRRFTEDNVTMSVKAAQKALQASGTDPREVELIVYGSAHQDQMPTASVRIQEALGIEQCAEISVHANCTSAYKALAIAHDMICNGRFRNALVLSSSMSSSELVAEYYNQPLVKKEELFLRYFLSDGAAGLFLTAETVRGEGLYLDHTTFESIGGKKPAAMGNRRPAYWMNPREEFETGRHHLSQMFQEELRTNFHEEGGSVFFKGLKRMIDLYKPELARLRFFQVNFPSRHISELVMDECAALGIPRETLYSKMAAMGYIGPPMAFLCLDRIVREEHLQTGDLIMSFVTEVSKFMQAGFIISEG
jgi:3-oxoacyl-[acyl-carrier-protein] synthase-3